MHVCRQWNHWSIKCSWNTALLALLRLHLHYRINTWLHWIGERQLRDETRNSDVLGFDASYIIGYIVITMTADGLSLTGTRPSAGTVMTKLRSHICTCLTLEGTSRLKQNGRHFADDTFKCIFLNENVRISLKISLKFVPKGPINNIPALVQIMVWQQSGDKPLSEPMIAYIIDTYMRHSASVG